MADKLKSRIEKLEAVKRKGTKLTWKEFVDHASRDILPAEYQADWEKFIKDNDDDRQTQNPS